MAILKGQMRRDVVKEGVSKKNGKEYYIRNIMFLENGSDESIPVNVSKDFEFEQGRECEIEVILERDGYGIRVTLKE